LCAEQGLPFVLGHALSLKAIHGGKATHDTIDSPKIAALRRGGMLPQADVYPADRRATRDLLRRRTHLRRQRSALLAHVPHTNSPDNLPEIGTNIADKANREGVAARFPDQAVQKNIEVDLALLTYDDKLLSDLELSIRNTAQHHDAHTLYLWQTVPGIGNILSLVRLDEIHDMDRFPRVQAFAAYGRLVTCAKESAGKRLGPSGQKIGNAHLKWAFSEAATLCLRHHEPGQKYLARLEKKHDQGKALTILAHTLARAVYDMLRRMTAFDMHLFLHTEGAARVSPAPHGTPRGGACMERVWACLPVSLNAKMRLGLISLSLPGCLDTRSGFLKDGASHTRLACAAPCIFIP
jgi:transposase